ncbi:LPXTG cell wall anchor domain-containing protein [Periweissella cryptocerci]|uniref:LPXTG cell wall anchor domain-containing protein n=1 Tax=Periweissella cryptocerci TaxID=2506420 RepID=A0A4P6YSR9_9LACO|nr:leucine-rich repeat protein [Periweissella cryptocerci]QBO35673.1 LPXTG cell wall anchor domain-containing protein [Periweissella cryptocerci]
MTNKTKHSKLYHQGRHTGYVGMAAITLIGGMGVTPVVLAEELVTEQIETAVKHDSVDDNSTEESVQSSVQSNDNLTENNLNFNLEDDAQSRIIAPTTNIAKQKAKDKDSRFGTASYQFTNLDFTYEDDGATVTGFSEHFLNNPNFDLTNWDGVLVFPKDVMTNVTAIGEYAFYDAYYTIVPKLISKLDLSGLANLKTIKEGAFINNVITEVNFSGLSKLETIGFRGFSGNTLSEVDLSPLTKLSDMGIEGFSYNFNLQKVTFPKSNIITMIPEWTFNYAQLLTTIDLSVLPNLESIGEGAFSAAPIAELDISSLSKLNYIGDGAFSNSYFSPSLKKIIVGNNPDLEMGEDSFSAVVKGSEVLPIDSTALETAEKVRDFINKAPHNLFTGKNLWYIAATATQKYVDQNDNVITQDINGVPLTPAKITTKVGTTYDNGPTIAGYDEPEIVGGSTTGTYDALTQEVTYKYIRSKAPKFTVYYVDENDIQIAPLQTLEDVPESVLDLTPQSIDGYDYKNLFGSNAVSKSLRAVPDLSWQPADELAKTKINYGDNNGRSYKFVYSLKTIPADNNNPDKAGGNGSNTPASTTPTPGKLPSSGGGTIPAKKPSTSGDTTPTKKPSVTTPVALPGSGGTPTTTRTNGANRVVNTTNTIGTNRNSAATANQATRLPKSGNTANRMLPILGTAVLVGILGLYGLRKKRK